MVSRASSFYFVVSAIGSVLWAPHVHAACADLVIDDFSKFAASGYMNALDGWTSDDGTAVAKTGQTGTLTITPKSDGSTYWYFAGICGKTGAAGTYAGVSLTITPPADARTLSLNLRTAASCTGAVANTYYTANLIPGQVNTLQIPFTSFTGANLNNIISLNLEGFTGVAPYSFGPIRFYCPASTATSNPTTTGPVTTTSPATPLPVSTSCLVIDNYSKFASTGYLNSLGGWSNDDGTMTAKSFSNGQLVLTATTTSYFYFGGLCGTQGGNIGASTSYTGVYFTITPPAANTFVQVNMRSSTTCNGAAVNSYYTATLGAAGTPTTVQVPFTAFGGLNPANVLSVNLEGFSVAGEYKIGPLSYYCGTPPTTTTTAAVTPTPSVYPITKDGTCGPRSLDGNGVMYRCPTSGNVCCSDIGLCGNNLTSCGVTFYSCRSAFGKCSGPQPEPAPNSYPPVSPTKRAAWITKCTTPGLFALTYDDGPSSLVGQLLNVLKTNNVKATFFINAYNRADITVDPFKTFLTNAYRDGHQIASHTYDHVDMTTLDTQGNWAQMWRNDKAMASVLGGKMPVYMRPPYGAYNTATLDMIGSWGYKAVWMNIDSLDFQYSGRPNAVQLMQASYDGSLQFTSPRNTSFISLQHDFVPETVVPWTQRVISQMKRRGYKLVTVGECLGDPNPASWYRNVTQWPQWA